MPNKNKFNGSINRPFVPEKKQDDKKARNVAIVLLVILAFCCFGSVLAIGLTVKDCTTANAEEFVSESVPVPEGYPNLIHLQEKDYPHDFCSFVSENTFTCQSFYNIEGTKTISRGIPYKVFLKANTSYTAYISFSNIPSGYTVPSLTILGYAQLTPFSVLHVTPDVSGEYSLAFSLSYTGNITDQPVVFASPVLISVGLWEGDFSNSDFASSVYYQSGLLQGQTDGYKLGYTEGYSKGEEDTVMNFDPNSLFYPFDYNNLSALYSITSSGSTSSYKIGFTSDNNTLSFARGTLSFPTNNELVTGKSITVAFADFVPLYASSFKVLNVSFISDLLSRYPENEGYAIDFLLNFYTSPLYSGSDPDPYFDINTSVVSTASARVLSSGELEFDLVNTSFPLKIYGFSFSDFVHVWKANTDNVYEIVYTYNLTASQFFGVAVEFSGYANDYNSGYKEGYSVGSSSGYNRGYSEGVKAAGDYTFLSLLGSVVDAPLQAVSGMLNFNLLGFNMLNFFYALLTCALVIAVIRLIL